jgi:hypothetical protein
MPDFWNVQVSMVSAGSTRADFGTPLIVGFKQRTSDVITVCSTAADVLSAGYTTSDAEYAVAAAIDAQSIRTPIYKIGRRQLAPTPAVTITPTAVNSKIYRLLINGSAAEYTSDSSATVGEICTGLKAAIDALAPSAWLVDHTYTANQTVKNDSGKIYKCTIGGVSASSGGPTGIGTAIVDNTVTWEMIGVVPTVTNASTYITIVSPISGQTVFVAIDASSPYVGYAGLSLEVTHADPGIATDLTALKVQDPDWYCFSLIGASTEEIEEAAAWATSNNKLYFQASPNTNLITSTTNIAGTLLLANNPTVAMVYRADVSNMYEFRVMSIGLAKPAGSDNWAYIQVIGSLPDYLTTTHISNLTTNRVGYCVLSYGVAEFQEGMTLAANIWIDLVRGRDWWVNELGAALHDAQVAASNTSSGKIPYTEDGVSVIKGVIRAAFLEGVRRNFLVAGSLQITTLPIADVPLAVKATRRYPYVAVAATLTGVINGGTVSITLV